MAPTVEHGHMSRTFNDVEVINLWHKFKSSLSHYIRGKGARSQIDLPHELQYYYLGCLGT